MNSKIILSLVSQEEIMMRYFGHFEFKKYYLNPWRYDKNPKCFFNYRGGTLYFMDFGNDIRLINCFQACMYANSCSYYECLRIIDRDFNLMLDPYESYSGNKPTPKKVEIDIEKPEITKKAEFYFEYQPFQSWDLQFWKDYHYTEELLKEMKIQSCKRIFRNDFVWCSSYENNFQFSYSDSLGEFKIYRPSSASHLKWRTLRDVLQGYDILRNDDILFITSSYKDVGTLKLLKYQALAPNSETSITLLCQKLPELKERFKYIYVFHDSDSTGKEASLKLTKEQELNYINTPNKYLEEGIKDPSDLSKKHGLDTLKSVIDEKLIRDGLERFIKK